MTAVTQLPRPIRLRARRRREPRRDPGRHAPSAVRALGGPPAAGVVVTLLGRCADRLHLEGRHIRRNRCSRCTRRRRCNGGSECRPPSPHSLRIPTPRTVNKLPMTPMLPAVATLPATAALPAVETLPATATLPGTATLPATARRCRRRRRSLPHRRCLRWRWSRAWGSVRGRLASSRWTCSPASHPRGAPVVGTVRGRRNQAPSTPAAVSVDTQSFFDRFAGVGS